jgi:hypothetical protein
MYKTPNPYQARAVNRQKEVAPQLASVCRYILEHYDRFALTPEIYGDLRRRYQALEQAFLRHENVA